MLEKPRKKTQGRVGQMLLRGRELQSIFQASAAIRGESHHAKPWRRAAQALLQGGGKEGQKPNMCGEEKAGRQEGSRNKPSPEGRGN